jgi:hypothetical protein
LVFVGLISSHVAMIIPEEKEVGIADYDEKRGRKLCSLS